MAKIYLSKHALTRGIEEIDVEVQPNDQYVFYKFNHYKIGYDCFLSLKEALDKAESMRISKIESLYKQIDKLKKMNFKNES